MTLLNFFKIDTRASTCHLTKSATIIIDNISLALNNAFQRWDGRALISNIGAFLMKGLEGRVAYSSSLNLNF